MDFGALEGSLPIILIIVGLILLPFLFRRRFKPEARQREIASNLLLEVRVNRALVETAHAREKPKKFAMTTWRMHKTKLDFLARPLQGALSDAFTMVEDFNQQIDAAKKYRSASYMVSLDVSKLKEPLTKSQEGLEEWLLSKTGGKEPPLDYPNVFDTLFGRGWRR